MWGKLNFERTAVFTFLRYREAKRSIGKCRFYLQTRPQVTKLKQNSNSYLQQLDAVSYAGLPSVLQVSQQYSKQTFGKPDGDMVVIWRSVISTQLNCFL